METNEIIIVLSALTVASYLFGILSKWTRIPAVILLLSTGIVLKLIVPGASLFAEIQDQLLQFLGTLGLVMIVLEASLDLKVTREKLPVIRDAFLSALVILVVSSITIAALIQLWLGDPWRNCLIYSIPLSIISSAIVIPSTEHLSESKKEFVVYESSFSDILGIVFFNFMISKPEIDVLTPFGFALEFIIVLVAAFAGSLLLLWLAARITSTIRHFFLLAVLFLLYSFGKLIHVPALVLVLIYGLLLNNFQLFTRRRPMKLIDPTVLQTVLDQFKTITGESSFIIRTFFFILFGFTIELATLFNPTALVAGIGVIAVLLVIRSLYFSYFLKTNVFPEIFLMPRGLITILLFFSIPAQYALRHFEQSIVFLVVIVTTVLMAFALMFHRPTVESD